MKDIVKNDGGNLINFLHRNDGALVMPQPFERDILLLSTRVAGTSYISGIEELEPYLHINDRLNFFREPDNYFDEEAIIIKNTDGVKIGYVPKQDNTILARLMDAGKLIFGKITEKEMLGAWLHISIDIYMRD